ncbi:PREDICTED: uncharacterized protein LOC100633273 [Amphimedon queenslandica]|uniref:Mutator-like transposase domain-containing protein n=1 Tax=Amphimedon queenslandica TaxID=400682 RepID=A0AAN0IQ18_AMPQE|nr:PREDICTED: uncharacterized protein LOC100633273 [Amphimedon queenslandica]|eukprot:XP_011407083.1 PREDICTED: uncharacterized protein LOC100633273 [Amphimedon queenslandica]
MEYETDGESDASTCISEADFSFEDDGNMSDDDYPSYDSATCRERTYLVFESCLLHLFSHTCSNCNRPVQYTLNTIGSMLQVKVYCGFCEDEWTWNSQPYLNDCTPNGNVLIAFSIIFSRSFLSKVLRLFAIMNCACISEATFYSRQMKYLRQAVSNVWKEHQNSMLTVLQVEKKPLILGGDGRCDSPGFSTKNGSYTFLEIEHNVVLNIELVQSNEVSGSTNMEKECFMRGMKIFEVYDLPIKMLVTDRHKQLGKYIREDLPQIDHKFDVWHIAKSFRKKVKKLAKRKGCEEVGSWIKRMVNHLYWAAMSSEDGDPEMILEKWLSLRRHIHNKHHGHGTKYKKCAHGRLRKRRWLKYRYSLYPVGLEPVVD